MYMYIYINMLIVLLEHLVSAHVAVVYNISLMTVVPTVSTL